METELFLASTPLHILNSVAIASSHNTEAHLWLIDQPDIDNNPYYQILSRWSDSPFASINISQGHIRNPLNKLRNRKVIFTELGDWVKRNKPSVIYTGNDRRIEFQYSMHCASALGAVKGIYMDEGTFTYVGRSASRGVSDRIIDNTIKKLIYGIWWKNPITVGGSEWVSSVYAAFPDLVHPLLQAKNMIPLQPLYAGNQSVKEFCRQLAAYFSAPSDDISSIECVLTLPHESIIERIRGYKEAMLKIVDQLKAAGLKTGIKYHPRNQNPDILNAEKIAGFTVLPYRIPFEALLPLLPDDVIIIGDVSSTLINSCWLKPNARLLSVANPEVPLYDEFCALFDELGVQVTESSQVADSLCKALR